MRGVGGWEERKSMALKDLQVALNGWSMELERREGARVEAWEAVGGQSTQGFVCPGF